MEPNNTNNSISPTSPSVTMSDMVPPNIPTTKHNQRSEGQGSHKSFFVIVGVIVVLVILYLILSVLGVFKSGPPYVPVADGVEVTIADKNSATERLPAGFPQDIPVDTDTLTESTQADYTEYSITQYTVGYTSSQSQGALWADYQAFMLQNGYEIDIENTDDTYGVMRGILGPDELNVLIMRRGNGSHITINYLDRN